MQPAPYQMLRDLAPFRGCSDRQLRAADRLMARLRIPAGGVLCHEGSAGRECFLVASGAIRVTWGDREIAVSRAGDWVGELALLGRHPRTATATAVVDSAVYVLDAREFTTLLAVAPPVAAQLSTVVAERRRQTPVSSIHAPPPFATP